MKQKGQSMPRQQTLETQDGIIINYPTSLNPPTTEKPSIRESKPTTNTGLNPGLLLQHIQSLKEQANKPHFHHSHSIPHYGYEVDYSYPLNLHDDSYGLDIYDLPSYGYDLDHHHSSSGSIKDLVHLLKSHYSSPSFHKETYGQIIPIKHGGLYSDLIEKDKYSHFGSYGSYGYGTKPISGYVRPYGSYQPSHHHRPPLYPHHQPLHHHQHPSPHYGPSVVVTEIVNNGYGFPHYTAHTAYIKPSYHISTVSPTTYILTHTIPETKVTTTLIAITQTNSIPGHYHPHFPYHHHHHPYGHIHFAPAKPSTVTTTVTPTTAIKLQQGTATIAINQPTGKFLIRKVKPGENNENIEETEATETVSKILTNDDIEGRVMGLDSPVLYSSAEPITNHYSNVKSKNNQRDRKLALEKHPLIPKLVLPNQGISKSSKKKNSKAFNLKDLDHLAVISKNKFIENESNPKS